MTNVELIVQTLERAGVRWVFGVPSGPVLPLIEALRLSASIDFVLTATETSAAFMAEAVGRTSGAPGVCVATVGPGATNLATGVGGAWLDRSAVIAIVCTYDEHLLDRRTQMRIDHLALFAPLTKAQRRLSRTGVASEMAGAIALATAEPPGPVILELPEDVGTAEASGSVPSLTIGGGLGLAVPGVDQQVRDALASAQRPLVVTGLTFTRSRAADKLLAFVKRQRLPYVSTLHAKGFLPESYIGSLGVIGRARRTDIQHIVDTADLIVAIGYDPIEINYEEWVGDIPVAHLSTEPADADGSIRFVVDAVGDLDAMLAALAELPAVPNNWQEREWEEHRSRLDANLRPVSLELATHHVLDSLRSRLPYDAIVTYDVGAHTHQIASQWRTNLPHTALSTNGWSSMGYGMPSAYAAKLVHPDRTVVGVIGDGCFQMTVGELATARRLGLRVPIIVLNDGWLVLMKVKQERGHFGSYGSFLGEQPETPEHYFGVPCRAARDEESLSAALDWGLALDGPSVIEAFIDVAPYSATVFDE